MELNVLRFIFTVLKDWGAVSVGLLSLGVNIWFIWKLFTNHLHHIQLGIDENKEAINKINTKVDNIEKDIIIIQATKKIKGVR